jgi:enoyl-CoA hydratase
MTELIQYQIEGPITRITINHPNCLMSNDMAIELAARLGEFDSAHLVVLRSAGPDFVAGRQVPPFSHKPSAIDVRRVSTEPPLRLVGAVKACRAPVLALVRGRCVGLGAALAAACDITFADETAKFILPEMDHGIPPCLAMSGLLHRVPTKQIAYMTYSCEAIDAHEAHRLGLITKVFETETELHDAGERFIAKVAGHKQTAMVGVKDFLRSAPALDATALAGFASNLLANIVSSHEDTH